MTRTIIEADVEEVVLDWLEGLGGNITIRPKLNSGELRAVSWNTGKESAEVVSADNNL